MPTVSIVMNCLNGQRYLKEALDSVYAQTFDDWEIIFWDNGSSDKSGEIAQSYDEKLRYFREEKTSLLGKARNAAFNQAKGKYIAILDVDDVWLENKLERQVDFSDKNPHLGMTFTNSIYFYEDGNTLEMFNLVQPHRGYVFKQLLCQNFISTETMMFKKGALESLDYMFDDEFTMVMDYDLTLRLAYHCEFDFIDEPLSKWRIHEQSGTIKCRTLMPREGMELIEKLEKNIPDLYDNYGNEISMLIKSTNCQYAMVHWYNNQKVLARECLRPYLSDKTYFFTYLMTYILSYPLFEKFKERLKKLLKG